MTQLHFGAHIPWTQIETYLDMVLDLNLVPEIAIKGPELDLLDDNLICLVTEKLLSADVRPTVHAPFFDLNPGALDPLVRQVTQVRLTQALSFAGRLNAHLMVIHPGVDKWRYPNLDQIWLSFAKEFFLPLIEQASACRCRLAIENIYEEEPDLLVQLVQELNSKSFGHCFDAGHWHMFGKEPMAEWLEAISSKLFHLHLHDNHGLADEHLPVGEGKIDFSPLINKLQKLSSRPSMTLEAHTPEHLTRSLKKITELLS